MAQNGTSPAAEGGRENGASAGAETNRFENGGGLSRRDRGPSVVMGRMLPPSSVQGKVSSLNAPRTLGDARTDVLSGWLDVAVHNRGGQRCSAGCEEALAESAKRRGGGEAHAATGSYPSFLCSTRSLHHVRY
eukprot:220784-Rhodomonas_salina.2